MMGCVAWGGSARLGIAERPGLREYADWWRETGVLWMQIESVEAVDERPGISPRRAWTASPSAPPT